MILLNCPINSLSYGLSSLSLLRELDKKERIALWPIGPIDVETKSDADLVQKCINYQTEFDPEAPAIRIYHQHDMSMFPGKGPKWGWPIFELTEFQKHEKHHLGIPDELIVCSEWAKDIIWNEIGRKSHVVPLGVNPNIFYPRVTEDNDKCTFLYLGKIELRKNIDTLHECFHRAFENVPNVELQMMITNPLYTQQEIQEWYRLYKKLLGDKVIFLPWVKSQAEVAEVISGCDAFVLPSNAEGFCLPLLEAMAMGKECIATNYSGSTQFTNNNNCRLIEIDQLETAYDGKWFTSGVGQWAEFGENQQDQLVNHLKAVYNSWVKNGRFFNVPGVDTGKQFTWENSVDILLEAIQ